MGILNYLQFDDVKSSDYGIYISGEATFDAPKRSVETISIPGRNGDLVIDQGRFENIVVSYPAFNFEEDLQNFRDKLTGLRSGLCSKVEYQKLTDTFHPDEFRLGVYKEGLEVKPIMYNTAANFDIKFDCKPQRFLVSGEDPIVLTSGALITNPTLFYAKPLLKVKGNGTVKIEPYEFIVSGNTGEIWIDSELMESYKLVHVLQNLTDEELVDIQDENGVDIQVSKEATPEAMDALIEFVNYVYPQIKPGDVPVWISSGIEELTIIPRWWRL